MTTDTTRGRLTKRVQYSKGHPKNPFSNDELSAKFLDAVSPMLGAERAEEIAGDVIWHIDSAGKRRVQCPG